MGICNSNDSLDKKIQKDLNFELKKPREPPTFELLTPQNEFISSLSKFYEKIHLISQIKTDKNESKSTEIIESIPNDPKLSKLLLKKHQNYLLNTDYGKLLTLDIINIIIYLTYLVEFDQTITLPQVNNENEHNFLTDDQPKFKFIKPEKELSNSYGYLFICDLNEYNTQEFKDFMTNYRKIVNHTPFYTNNIFLVFVNKEEFSSKCKINGIKKFFTDYKGSEEETSQFIRYLSDYFKEIDLGSYHWEFGSPRNCKVLSIVLHENIQVFKEQCKQLCFAIIESSLAKSS